MSKKCKHGRTTGYMWRDRKYAGMQWHHAFVQPGDVAHHDKVTCDDCGANVPLGPASDDDERVRVEMAAAEMVTACSAPAASWIEADETRCIDSDCDDDCDVCQLFQLAAVIAAHDDTDEGGE